MKCFSTKKDNKHHVESVEVDYLDNTVLVVMFSCNQTFSDQGSQCF